MWAPRHYPTAPRMGLPRHHQHTPALPINGGRGATHEACRSVLILMFRLGLGWKSRRSPGFGRLASTLLVPSPDFPLIPTNAQGLEQGYVISYIACFINVPFRFSCSYVCSSSDYYLASPSDHGRRPNLKQIRAGVWARGGLEMQRETHGARYVRGRMTVHLQIPGFTSFTPSC
jgi:hypothetical protein